MLRKQSNTIITCYCSLVFFSLDFYYSTTCIFFSYYVQRHRRSGYSTKRLFDKWWWLPIWSLL